jgi:hypothetical protein
MWPDGARLFKRGPISVAIDRAIVPVGDGWPEMVRLRDLTRAAVARGSGEPADLPS